MNAKRLAAEQAAMRERWRKERRARIDAMPKVKSKPSISYKERLNLGKACQIAAEITNNPVLRSALNRSALWLSGVMDEVLIDRDEFRKWKEGQLRG